MGGNVLILMTVSVLFKKVEGRKLKKDEEMNENVSLPAIDNNMQHQKENCNSYVVTFSINFLLTHVSLLKGL